MQELTLRLQPASEYEAAEYRVPDPGNLKVRVSSDSIPVDQVVNCTQLYCGRRCSFECGGRLRLQLLVRDINYKCNAFFR